MLDIHHKWDWLFYCCGEPWNSVGPEFHFMTSFVLSNCNWMDQETGICSWKVVSVHLLTGSWSLPHDHMSDLLTAVFSLLDRWRFSSETKSTFIAAVVFFSVFHVLWLLQDSENGVALFVHRSERCLFFWSLDIFVQFFLRSHIFCSISGCLPFLGSRDQTYVLSNIFKANSANRRSCYVESRELRKLMKWLSYWNFFMGPKLNHIDCR